jgi:DNA-directed RNA polymerase subunit beta'
MLVGKNLTSRKNGLFDPEITGGAKGTQWGHITLADRIPNPMFEDAIIKALDLTENSYQAILDGKQELNGKTGHTAIIDALKEIDVNKRTEELKEQLKVAPPTNVNKLNTKVRYMEALQDLKMTPLKAYTISKVPIIPPVFRPAYPLPSGDLAVSDINKHYRAVGLVNNQLISAFDVLPDKDKLDGIRDLYTSIKAMQGFIDPITYSKEKYKGYLQELGRMKTGLIHGKAWSHRQDVSGRSTITVEPALGLNEVGIPKEFAYTAYKPFILRSLKESGIKATQALKLYEDKSPTAYLALESVMKDRPVILNRAPSLHKHSIQAFRPILTTGKSIRLNPLIVKGFNADFDGDTMSVMVPIGKEAVEEARQMIPSKILFKHGDNSLMPGISADYLFGLHALSLITQGTTKKKFASISEAKSSGIPWTELFSLNGKDMTIGQYMINAELPTTLKDYTRTMDKKVVNNILTELGKKYPTFVEEVFNSWKDLGAAYSYLNGNTISITDFAIDHSYRDSILNKEMPATEKLKLDDRATAMNAITKRVQAEQDKELSQKNNIYKMLTAGSFSKPDSVRQILSMPGVLNDIENKPLPIPVTKSYGEGLDSSSYFNTMYSARKGTVDRSSTNWSTYKRCIKRSS